MHPGPLQYRAHVQACGLHRNCPRVRSTVGSLEREIERASAAFHCQTHVRLGALEPRPDSIEVSLLRGTALEACYKARWLERPRLVACLLWGKHRGYQCRTQTARRGIHRPLVDFLVGVVYSAWMRDGGEYRRVSGARGAMQQYPAQGSGEQVLLGGSHTCLVTLRRCR
jgi:hypothetical protein